MNCAAFDRWLDDGMPEAEAPAAAAHAAACPRCARALEAALVLETVLAQPSAAAPAGFDARVWERIDAIEARARALPAAPEPVTGLAWWIAVAAEPAVALALGLAAVALWQVHTIAYFGAVLLLVIKSGLAGLAHVVAPLAAPYLTPQAAPGIVLLLGAALGYGSWQLYVWSERATIVARTRPARGSAA